MPLPGQGSEITQQQEESCAQLALEICAGKDVAEAEPSRAQQHLGVLLCKVSQAVGFLSSPGLVVWPQELFFTFGIHH